MNYKNNQPPQARKPPHHQPLPSERTEQVNRILYTIANAVNTTLDLTDLYQVIHHALETIIDVNNFFIAIVDKRKTLYFPYFVDSADDDFEPINDFNENDSLTGLVVSGKKPVLLIEDELKKRQRQGGVWGPVPKVWLGVPLIIRNEAIGAIAVQSYTNEDQYSVEDLDLLGVIADHIAIAIDRKQSLDNLKKSEQKYRNLFHNAQAGLFRIDADGKRLLECNDTAAHMLGYHDRRDLLDNFVQENFIIDRKQALTFFHMVKNLGRTDFNETAMRKKDGETGWYRFSASYNPEEQWIEGVVVDITEIKTANEERLKLKEKLEQKKKMEALGLLAGGVAHDLNNIFAGIISYPELLLMKMDDKDKLKRPLETILEAGQRGALIVSDMLAIARSAAHVKEHRCLHDLVNEFLESPECRQLKQRYPDIMLNLKLEANKSIVHCSPVHINKCLVNLFTNAFEAIQESGSVTCSSQNTPYPDTPDQENTQNHGIRLSIEDTGPGIADKDIAHVFEPFYTRKTMGRSGTGLGLTVVWNTMKEHDGTVSVHNTGKGSCFSLAFPLSAEKCEKSKNKEQALFRGGGESILVVDDEEHLRNISFEILESLGYRVRTVASGEDAIAYLTDNRVDLVLLDMLMDPGINGFETYREISKIHPGQKAIIASGFSESEKVKAALDAGVGRFIKKPYSIEQLSRTIWEELST